MAKLADIGHAMAVLHWDKETYLPKKGGAARGRQLATLGAIAHETFIDPDFGSLLKSLTQQQSLSAKQKKNVQLTYKSYLKAKKFKSDFVRKKSLAINTAYSAWIAAREKNDYALYVEPLQALIDIVREEAEILGYEDHPYDACLDQYEPDMTVAILEPFFASVKKDLKPLLRKIKKAKPIKARFLDKKYPKDDQWAFGLEVLKNIGYDFDAGRQDVSPHPFTTSFSPQDVRVTTRIDEYDLLNMTWSCIHEGGHALYEQGLPSEEYGLPSGSAISLSMHESQSRLYENNVGRSYSYWTYLYPRLQKRFPKQLGKVSLDQFYKAINTVSPNEIRTEADELHYHFHVLIRYEIEKEIMEGKIQAADLKKVWNKKYKSYLGVTPRDDNHGILQDVHWAHGSIGYFPTYSLGSFYAAQIYAKAEATMPKLSSQLARGRTKDLLKFLREEMHQYGKQYNAEEMCEKITGEPLNTRYFIEYAKAKYGEVYGL